MNTRAKELWFFGCFNSKRQIFFLAMEDPADAIFADIEIAVFEVRALPSRHSLMVAKFSLATLTAINEAKIVSTITVPLIFVISILMLCSSKFELYELVRVELRQVNLIWQLNFTPIVFIYFFFHFTDRSFDSHQFRRLIDVFSARPTATHI